MKLIEHLNIIEELVLNRASPAEIRNHIVAMRPTLEAYDKTLEEHAALQISKTATDAKTQALETELAKFKAHPKPMPVITIKTAAHGFKSIGP